MRFLDKEDMGGMYVCNLDLTPETEGEIEWRLSGEKRSENYGPCEDDSETVVPFLFGINFHSKIGRKSSSEPGNPFPEYRPAFLGKGSRNTNNHGKSLTTEYYERSGEFIFRKL